jgi:hypothetical protein
MVKKDNFVPVQDLAGNYIDVPREQENITMEIKEIKKRGRPKKYATIEEARKAKIANTIASAKKRKEKQGKGMFIDHLKSIFTGTAEPSEYVLFVLAKVALYLLHRKSKKILKDRYGVEGSWFPILKLLAEGTKEAYSRAIGQGGANVIRNLGQIVVDNTDLQDDLEQQVEGSGLFSNFNKAVKSVVNKVKDTATAVIYGRDDYPPKVRDTISKYGDKVITGITLGRTPLGKPLMTALQVASGNTFSQKLENTPYDKLFHLFMCIEFANGKIVLEKNEVINTENSCKIPKDTETKVITSSDIPTGLTLIDALNKTKERMGGKFFTYSAKDNNCQDFIVAFLTANNIGNETDKSWVKQETKVLFEGNDRLRKIANTLTDIGARVDVLRQGAGIIDFEDMKWGSFSKQLKAYNSQHNKKLDLHNFAMMILANPDKFQERTKKRARFYINIILKKGGMIDEENDPLFQNPLPIVANPPPPPPPPEPEPVNIPTPVATKKNDKKKGGMIGSDPYAGMTDYLGRPVVIKNQSAIEAERLKKIRGYGKIKSPNNNISMANKWIEYVKSYAKKNNMKYSEALKDPKCKAGYKSGEGVFDVLKSVGQAVAPVAIDLASQYAKKKISGSGMPTSRDAYIAELYDQANLGANGRVNLN